MNGATIAMALLEVFLLAALAFSIAYALRIRKSVKARENAELSQEAGTIAVVPTGNHLRLLKNQRLKVVQITTPEIAEDVQLR